MVAIDKDSNSILAVGEEARRMLGRTPGNIVAIRPLREGVISNYDVTEKMLQYFIEKALGKRSFVKPTIAVCVPSSVTEVEKRAVEDATRQAQDACILLKNPLRQPLVPVLIFPEHAAAW